ncbi:hypothetical protein, partial [Pseudomonas viridiflava]
QRLRRSAVAQQTPDRGRRLAGDERLRDFPDTPRRLHRRQAASHKKRFHSADYVLFDKRRLVARQRYI